MYMCGLCRNHVSKLKSGSHVIPRWIMTAVKNGSPMVRIADSVIMNWQKDLIGEFVCHTCEQVFEKDDTFSVKVLRDGIGTPAGSAIDSAGNPFSLEIFEAGHRSPFIRFVVGVLLRDHMYHSVLGKEGVLGTKFEELRVHYHEKKSIGELYSVYFERYSKINLFVRGPQMYDLNGMQVIDIVLLGWRFIMRLDDGPRTEFDTLARAPGFNVKVYEKQGPLLDALHEEFKNGVRKGALARKK